MELMKSQRVDWLHGWLKLMGCLKDLLNLPNLLLRKSQKSEVFIEEYNFNYAPVVVFDGNFLVSFIVPYNLKFSKNGVEGIISEEEVSISAGDVVFKGSSDEIVNSNALVDLALEFDLPLPVNYLIPDVGRGKFILKDPKGETVFWLNERSYYVKYEVLCGRMLKKTEFLNWLEATINDEIENSYKKHIRKGDIIEVWAGNFSVKYHTKEEIVLDLFFATDDRNLFMTLKETKILIKDKQDKIRIEIPIGNWTIQI